MTQRIVYLHGFASSPQSTKAQFFRRRFEDRGFAVEIPQLDQGDFRALTITRQLEVIGRAAQDQPAIVMGSSLGGYLAALYASRHSEVERLILMAPAFRFPSRWRARFSGVDLERWKQSGAAPFFHYAFLKEMPLGYQFVEDAAQYPEEPEFSQPALIFHGTPDDVVPAELSESFASRHANVRLRLFPSGHDLGDVLED